MLATAIMCVLMTTDTALLTVQDVARYCQVHEATVRRHIASGRLRSVHVGRAVRVRSEDLESYLKPEAQTASEATDDDDRSEPEWKPFTKDDSLWNIVGMIDNPDGDTWVSGDKHRALAEAYMPKP